MNKPTVASVTADLIAEQAALDVVVGEASSLDGLGACLGGDLYEAELAYLATHEYARSALALGLKIATPIR